MQSLRHDLATRAATVVALAGCLFITLAAAADVVTERFDLTSVPLGNFGVEFTIDYLSPYPRIRGGVVIDTRFHLVFDTRVEPNPFADAADLFLQWQPPVEGVPIFELTGADLGWSGTGVFEADFSTDDLNLPILDLGGADFALWFLRILSSNDEDPRLGGQLIDSYIEVDVERVPAPGGVVLLAAGFCARRRRRP